MEKEFSNCPVEMTLQLIGDKWKVLIIRDLLTGTKRFGELKKSVGNISQKVLTSNLRAMEESGLLIRKVYAEVPPKVEYTLTDLGYSLKPILDSMFNWGTEYMAKKEINLFHILSLEILITLIYKTINTFKIAETMVKGLANYSNI
ncbi:MAG: helix-turn-helix transcriptional regulator [Clostridium sp.]|nr:helix-turn-helix transcriptional regulator [Clostridium sp.]